MQTTYDTFESIGPGESEWRQEKSRMPVPLRQYGGCALNDVAYFIGGCDEHDGGKSGPASNQRGFLSFDPLTETWHSSTGACIENVGKSQSCMVSKVRMIWEQTVVVAAACCHPTLSLHKLRWLRHMTGMFGSSPATLQ